MIKITKPAAAPAILQGRGLIRQITDCREYELFPADYDNGTRKFTFDASIYGDATVKQALIDAQHGKCCFCETIIREEGDIEHFRPKAGFRQGKRTRLEKPGYYWLAYDWDNLLLACSICNQRHKGNLFPLVNPALRARNHDQAVLQEEPLFIHPVFADPARYIAFRQEVAYPRNNHPNGKATIQELGLNRSVLQEKRLTHLSHLNTYQKILDLESKLTGNAEGRELIAKARKFLSNAILDTAEFTAMTKAASEAGFRTTLL